MSSVMGGITKNAHIVNPDILDVSEEAGQLSPPLSAVQYYSTSLTQE